MKFIFILLLLPLIAFAQNGPQKHPRVLEVEEYIRDEASRYFATRFPNEPFFVRVEVAPLRRSEISGKKTESLPYFDFESEESVDEWDDPKTPLAFLRHRVTKVQLEVSVSEKFDDAKVASLKEEMIVYLKLLPFRDEVKVERSIKDNTPLIPISSYALFAGLLISAIVASLLIRSGFKKSSNDSAGASATPSPASLGTPPQSAQRRQDSGVKGSTAVSGDVTFHDPIKMIDIVHLKLSQIEKSETFPTLSDLVLLHDLGTRAPEKLGAILSELPSDWQKRLFSLGHGQQWLEAFCHSGRLDHECLVVLDRLGKERQYTGADRKWEDVLIQVWRMEEASINFLKKINIDHAFVILNKLPKSFALGVAKKTFPGAWGRLLDNREEQILISPQVLGDYLTQAEQIVAKFEWKMLTSYRRDRELLKYLDNVSIDDERDVYQTLSDDSFIFKVRPPFYKVFDLTGDEWTKIVSQYPLDKWALVVMNSSRQYIRQLSDVLDDKKKIVLSQYLKNFDQGFDSAEQVEWRKILASQVANLNIESNGENAQLTEKKENEDHAKSA